MNLKILEIKKVLDILAFLSASVAFVLVVLWAIGILKWITTVQMNIYLSNCIALYCSFYGISLLVQKKLRGFAMGLEVFAVGIIIANLLAMRF